ncbi:MAG: hypothetical protein JXR36_11295 [Bacteroidales bacterium]|nr:hypothetical protein [Bacteroidales bacterium]
MYQISISTNDTIRYKYTTSEDGHLYLDAGDYTNTYNIYFKNNRKLFVSGIFGYDVEGEEDPYFEFTKMLIQ